MDPTDDAGRDYGGARDETPDGLLSSPGEVLEGLPDAVVATGRDERIVFVNALAEELFGYPRAELLGRRVEMLWAERVRDRYTRNMRLYFATEHPMRFSAEVRGLRRDGSEFLGEMSWGIVQTVAGPLLVAIGRDISQRRVVEERLGAVAAMGVRALAGADPEELADEAVDLVRARLPVSRAEVRLAGRASIAPDGPIADSAERAVRVPIGARDQLVIECERGLDDDEMGLVLAVANTLAAALERRRGEDQMRHDAVHDPLTGLPNRTLLRDRLEHALARSEREGGATGVMFVDFDNFKQINDDFGHAAGDAVLAELGNRLATAVRPADTVARLGGDEFVVVCEEVDEDVALALGERLEQAIRVPLIVGGVEHGLSASIGIALGHSDADSLLRDADAASYRAKSGGGGRVELAIRP
jgi:diguanylate cyclase (GGDEF)-like protein/PAS domain S-box-containing protein